MTESDNTSGPSRRGLLGGVGLAATAQFAQFTLGSTPARAQNQSKPLQVAVVAQQMAAQSDQRSWDGFQKWLKATGLDKVSAQPG